jgi:hypothetical protein
VTATSSGITTGDEAADWPPVATVGTPTLNEACARGHIPLNLNTSAGGAYGGLTTSSRLIDRDPFWISVTAEDRYGKPASCLPSGLYGPEGQALGVIRSSDQGVTMAGLMWLGGPRYQSTPFCLTFVRGATEREVFTWFGADPAAAVPVVGSDLGGQPTVRVARSGDWLVAIEANIPPQGTRPEVLRRVSAGAEAIAVYQDIGKFNHELSYAADGDLIAAVQTTVPPNWSGSDPERIAAIARELGLGDNTRSDADPLQVLLALVERGFGLSLDEEICDRPWPAAPILPVPDDLPPPPPPGSPPPGIGDPVIDLYLTRATQQALITVLRARTGRLIADAGLSEYPDLVTAVQLALTHGPQPEAGALAKSLRTLARARQKAEMDLAVRRADLPAPEEELRGRVRRGQAAWALRFILAGRPHQALANDLLLQRTWHPATWRDQALADLSPAAHVRADELEAAERAWHATRHLPEPTGMTSTEPVRQHIQRLLDAGMNINRIAELSGMGSPGLDLILTRRIPEIPGYQARKIMTIDIP